MSHKMTVLATTALLTIFFGCASRLDNNWGRSYETARHAQTLNLEADKNLTPVEGIEGRAAERILEGHVKGQSDKKQSSSSLGVLTLQK